MKITLASIIVDDQARALNFYTESLGFEKKADMEIGPMRWLTVTAPEGVHCVELVLESSALPAKQDYQKAMYEANFPAFAFTTDDIGKDIATLRARGVIVRGEPQSMGPITSVVFEDGCGNLIHLVQPNG